MAIDKCAADQAMDALVESPWGKSDLAIGAQLDERAKGDDRVVYAKIDGRELTIGELAAMVNRAANGLASAGIRRGERVPIMLANHLDHVIVFFAMLKLGACMVPVNIHLRGEGLKYILKHSDARFMIIDGRFAEAIDPLLADLPPASVIWRERAGAGSDLGSILAHADCATRACLVEPDDVITISFTSGTTGLPKGVMVTDRMLRTCANAAARLCELKEGDVLYAWEPLYHIGGSEVLVMAVQHRVTLAMVERFSVTRFWSDVRRLGCTHIHFLGGVLALLLKEPPQPDDRDHPVRIAWGGGCPVEVWRAFEDRFGVPIRECYGMTECSSFTTQNLSGKIGSIGRPLPWFEVRIADDEGRQLGPGQRGELVVREKVAGVLMRGYFNNPEATAATLRDGWLYTGDVGRYDEEGDFYFLGRKKDSIRRRGENITAFEVERIANEHPCVAESAVVGVRNEISDEDVKIFLRLKPGASLDPLDFIRWAESRMAHFQVPRYVAFVDAFAKTPSERIRKEVLSREAAGIFDLEKSGYRVKRA
jgi:crotonobetaine/carnitine-CoA ligase